MTNQEKLTDLYDKLRFNPSVQKEFRGVVRSVVEDCLDQIVEPLPVRMGVKRLADEKKREIMIELL